ncbi:protein ROS1A isoform X2 [Nicotiana tabacum]|uniref:Protein ROS1A isoform X2 n=1 Tax=Nicotiana tabacum TaxID=4097 RepID=A0AC58UCX8_TOBAC
MELGNAAQEQLQKAVSWAPITPDKCMLATPEFNSNNADFNKVSSISSSDNSLKKDEEVSAVIEGRSKVQSGKLDCDSKSASMSPSTPIQKGYPRKKQGGIFDLNDRPRKKPRLKKHKPKIFDESKPKKTPKPKIKPSTPKPVNLKASARTKSKLRKDCDKVSVDLSGDSDMQAPNRKTPGTIPESLVLKVSTPQPEMEHNINVDLGHDVKSCRRALDFNLEIENDVISERAAEVIKDHVTHSCNKFLTNRLDGVNEQAVETDINCAANVDKESLIPNLIVLAKDESSHDTRASLLKANLHDGYDISTTGLEHNIEAESTSQPNRENEASTCQIDQRACQHHILNVYKRRTKSKTGMMSLPGNEAGIYQNDHGTTDQIGCQNRFLKVYGRRRRRNIGTLSLAGNEADIYPNDHEAPDQSDSQHHFPKVYKRRTRGNIGTISFIGDEADLYQNDRGSADQTGWHFPIICKKRRTKRRKALVFFNFLNAHHADKGQNALNTDMRCKVSSSAKRRYGRLGAKRATKKRFKIAKRAKKSCFIIAKRATRRSSRTASGTKKIWFSTVNLEQNVNLKSHFVGEVLPTEYQIRAAMADPESFDCVLGLSPIVKSRRKRSIHPKRTKSAYGEENTDLEPLSLALTLPPLVMSKRKRSKNSERSTVILDSLCLTSEISAINRIEPFIDTSACPEIQGCPQHEYLWPKADKSARNEIQECQQHEDVWPRTDISACNEIQEWPPHEDLWPRTDKSACNEIRECPQHEELWPRTDKSACNEIREYPQHEDLWRRTDKSACNEIQECLRHENLCPRSQSSTDLESLVASLIQRLENIRICDQRTYRKRIAISKKRTSNNAGQLVLWNPFGPITVHKGKYKPLRPKLPKVDIDTESLRVWKLLIENEGEIDEDLDKEKEIWWEEQRKIFQGRAVSFIARMRLVLGDRRFSQWKGSVVDSVVGVYLTQNVSDNLSSNAFMLLASAFPPQNKQEMTTPQGQAFMIREGMRDSFEREVCANQNDPGFAGSSRSAMSICRSSLDELSFVDDIHTSEYLPTSYRHLPHVGDCINERLDGTREEKNRPEDTCGSQVTVTCCSSEVIISTESGDCINERLDGTREDTCGSQVTVTSCSSEVIISTKCGDCINERLDGTREEKIRAEDTCGSQVTVASCSSEVIISANSGDCINERLDGTREENNRAEDTCGSQVTATSCSSEVRISANSGVCINERLDGTREDACGSQVTVTSCSSEVIISANSGDHINERSDGTREEKNIAEHTCGSQVTATSCSSEVIISAKSGDLGNEAVNLPKTISRKKDEFPKREIDWDELRKTYSTGRSGVLTERNRDSVNWEAVRHADVEKIFEPIKGRGQGNVLAAKIKNFLNRLVEDHGSIDLEWLRDVPRDKVKEYLLSIDGIGPKSVDCVRLLTLRNLAFPVDINVARIAVRLGWVPLQPLPDGIQMHLLERYPLESDIQKYLWPRLCNLDLLTLYELHYHMITFGKVFCTKRSPNCNACPMRADCRHFASAFASSRLRLPGPQQKGVVTVKQPVRVDEVPNMCLPSPTLSLSSRSFLESRFQTQDCEPIIEMPASPEQKPLESLERDIEDFPYEVEHEQEIPTIRLNTEEFRENVLNFINKSNTTEFQESVLNIVDEISTLNRDEEVSKALVLLNPVSASHPARKLKYESRLRTEHLVYELPDSHPLLSGFEEREPDDPCPYLLAICRTERRDAEICSGSPSSSQYDQIVYGTILIPCRTANRGSFPLNGTYFQVNEVFADHESSKNPIPVPRTSIWHLRRRTLLCGTSVTTIFKGMSTEDIQYCFWRGYMTVRGYDREQRAPRPLHDRFHSGSKSKR